MAKLSLEYQNAKENYTTAKSSTIRADGQENNRNEAADVAKGNSLRPAFGVLAEKKPEPQKQFGPRHLPIDYNTAKLKYKSSMSRIKSASKKGSTDSAKKSRELPKMPTNDPVRKCKSKQHSVESGLALLGLLRPLDSSAYEFGLAKGIQVHLIESIKLCGLKKGREKSLVDMVTTLCNHLTNREDEINRWIEFADQLVLAAAEKLELSLQEYQVICGSKDETQNALRDTQIALAKIRQELQSLKPELMEAKEGVNKMMVTFPSMMSNFQDRLRYQVESHCDGVRSESKSSNCDDIEELTTLHDNEKQRLEAVIGSFEITIHKEGERAKSLLSQIDGAASALEKERGEHKSVQLDLKEKLKRTSSELQEANEKIRSVEDLLEHAMIQKKKELDEKEAKMKAELDAIDHKVKQLFVSKNKEIQRALDRAHSAESSARAAEKLLAGLRASVIPSVSAAEGISES